MSTIPSEVTFRRNDEANSKLNILAFQHVCHSTDFATCLELRNTVTLPTPAVWKRSLHVTVTGSKRSTANRTFKNSKKCSRFDAMNWELRSKTRKPILLLHSSFYKLPEDSPHTNFPVEVSVHAKRCVETQDARRMKTGDAYSATINNTKDRTTSAFQDSSLCHLLFRWSCHFFPVSRPVTKLRFLLSAQNTLRSVYLIHHAHGMHASNTIAYHFM